MANGSVLHYATVLKSKSGETIKEALNLVEDLVKLFICIRSFSFANDQQEAYKIQKSSLGLDHLRKHSSN